MAIIDIKTNVLKRGTANIVVSFVLVMNKKLVWSVELTVHLLGDHGDS